MQKSYGRFETFVLSIDSIHKCINKIKQDIISDASAKSVHTLWLYLLLNSKEGLTSAELAAKSGIDRSLVSREIKSLLDEGYIVRKDGGAKRGYNIRYILTEKGETLAKSIAEAASMAQTIGGKDVSGEELEIFYKVLDKIRVNLEAAAKEGGA